MIPSSRLIFVEGGFFTPMNKLQANLCLLCVTLIWSTEVIIFACIPDTVSPFATTCITSLTGSILLFLCFFKRILSSFHEKGWVFFRRSLLLSILDLSYNVMYIYGLNDFDVSTGAFTLSMTVVILPVILMMSKKNVDVKSWLSAGLVLIGILFALARNLLSISIIGFFLIFCGCILRAILIIHLNRYAKEYDAIALSFSYTFPVAIFSFILWTILQPTSFFAIPWNKEIIASLFIYSYFIIALATTLNTFAQRRATPISATIIYSSEIIFSLIWGLLLPESLIDPITPDIFTWIGVLFIVLGNLAQLIDSIEISHRKKGSHETV